MTKTFPELLKQYRKENKLSQAAFAKKIGISQSMVAWYEVGKHRPTADDYPMFAKLLDMPIVELVNILYPTEQYNEYERFLVKLDSDLPLEEIQKDYKIVLDDMELTEEELKEAIESIRFNRFKKNNQQNVISFKQKD